MTRAKGAERAFEGARARYKEQMTAEEFRRFEQISSLNHLVAQAQAICKVLQTGAKSSSLESRIGKLALNLEPFERVLQGICKLPPLGGDLVWGSVSFILEISKDNVNVLEEVLEFLLGMSEEIEYLQVVEDTFGDSHMVVTAIEAVYVTIIKFWVQAMEYYRNKVKKDIISRVKLWISSSRMMSREFAQLKSTVKAQKTRLHEVEAAQHHANDKLHQAQLQASLKLSRWKELSQWIDAPQYEHDLIASNERRHGGTCEWLRERWEYRDWVKGRAGALLVIYGTAGMGKTILSSWIITEAQSRPAEHITLYHHFKETDDSKNSALAATRSILDQLFENLLSTGHSLVATIESDLQMVSRKNHIDFEPLWKILSSLLCQYCLVAESDVAFTITIVLDAIDECRDSRKLVRNLRKLVQDAKNKIHVAVTGRPSGDHVDEFRRTQLHETLPIIFELTKDDVNDDIKAFIAHSIRQIERLDDPKHHNLRDRIIRVFSDIRNHQGMFLWAHLTCKEVECRLRVSDIWALLDHLPRGLNGMYAQICRRLSNNDETSREFGLYVLQWIVASRRPMTFVELEEALKAATVDGNASSPVDFFDDDGGLLWSRTDIVRCCGDLVRYTGLAEGDTIGIVHLTARQFLSNHFSEVSPQDYDDITRTDHFFYIDIRSAELRIGITCIKYILSTSPLRHEYLRSPTRFGLARTPDRNAFKERYPLFDYAAIYWPEYALCAIQSQPCSDFEQLQQLLAVILEFTHARVSVIWLEELIRLTYVEYAQATIKRFIGLTNVVIPNGISHWSALMMRALLDFSLMLSTHPQMLRLCISHSQLMPLDISQTATDIIPPLDADFSRDWIHYDPVTDNLFSATSFPPPTFRCQAMATGARLRPLQISHLGPPDASSPYFYSAAHSASADLIALTYAYENRSYLGYLTICWAVNGSKVPSGTDDWGIPVFVDYTIDKRQMFWGRLVAFGSDNTIITPGGIFSLQTKQLVRRPSAIYDPDPISRISDTRFSGNGGYVGRIRDDMFEVLDISGTSRYCHEFEGQSKVKLRGFSDTGRKAIVQVEGKEAGLFCILVNEAKQISMLLPSNEIDAHRAVFTSDERRFVAVVRPRLAVWAFQQEEDGSYCDSADMIYIFEGRRFVFDLVPGILEDPVEDALVVESDGSITRQPLDIPLPRNGEEISKISWVLVWKHSFLMLVVWSLKQSNLLSVTRWSLESTQLKLISRVEQPVPISSQQLFKASPGGSYLITSTTITDVETTPNGFGVIQLDLLGEVRSAEVSMDETLLAYLHHDRGISTLRVFDISPGPEIIQRASFTFDRKIYDRIVFSKHNSSLLALGKYLMNLEGRRLEIQAQVETGIHGFSECGAYYYDWHHKLYRLPQTLVPKTAPAMSIRHVTSFASDINYIYPPHHFQLWALEGIVYLDHKLINDGAYRSRILWALPDAMTNQVTLIWPEEDSGKMTLLIVSKGSPTLIDIGIRKDELMEDDQWFRSEN